MSQTLTNVRPLHREPDQIPHEAMPNLWQRWFAPRTEVQRVTQQTKGVFLPYPLIAILVTVGALVLSGIIALEVQVSNLNTTILLRDADSRAQIKSLEEKTEQLQVYIHSDREKLIKLETQSDQRALDRAGVRR